MLDCSVSQPIPGQCAHFFPSLVITHRIQCISKPLVSWNKCVSAGLVQKCAHLARSPRNGLAKNTVGGESWEMVFFFFQQRWCDLPTPVTRRRNEARTTLLFFFTRGWDVHLRKTAGLSSVVVGDWECWCVSTSLILCNILGMVQCKCLLVNYCLCAFVCVVKYPQHCAESWVTELKVLNDHWELQ